MCTRAQVLPESPVLLDSWRSVRQESTDEGTSVWRHVRCSKLSLSLLWFTLTETDAVSPSVGLGSWRRDQCAVADR